MADNILKLKVETSEYDQKLANAAKGIRHLAEVAHQSGGELTGLEKAELDYVKALGEMETKSRTAAGGVRELESSYKELKVIYDQLNEVEKADEGGKALAASLEQIKQRAQEAKAQLESASQSLSDNGQQAQQSSGILDALASKFTLNIDALKLFDIGLSAVKGALNVAKDAFFSSETNMDDWGRTVQSAESVYQSFLVSLNTGDFSGFLSRIGQVTQAAKDAFDALDELGTRMTIINPERARLQARQQELRATIRRNGADSEVGKAALAELKKIEPLLSKSFKTESQMNYTAFEKLVRERLAEGGINLNQKSFQQFMKTFSSDAAFQNLRRNARGSLTTEMTGNAYNPNAAMTRRTVDTRNIEQKLLDLFTDEWRQANSGYLTASFSAQGAAASNALGNARYMKAGGSKGGNGGKDTKTEQTELQQNQTKINALTQEYVKLGDESTEAVRERQAEIQKEIELLQQRNGLLGLRAEQAQGRLLGYAGDFDKNTKNVGGIGMLDQSTNFGGDIAIPSGGLQLSDKAMDAVNKSLNNQKKDVKGVADEWMSVTSAIQSVSTAMASIEDPAAKVLGIVAQAIATVALTFSKSLKGTVTPWDWIAAAAAGTATMISTIAAIHSATGYAEGGMIKGNSYSGDNLMAMGPNGLIGLNAGEIVLNKSQQNNIASQLQGNPMGGMNLTATIRGEQIRLALNNNGRRTGRGEYVQSRNVR